MVFLRVFEGGLFQDCRLKCLLKGISEVFDVLKVLKTPPFLIPEMTEMTPPVFTPLYIYIYSGGLFLSLGSWDSERVSIQNGISFSLSGGFCPFWESFLEGCPTGGLCP